MKCFWSEEDQFIGRNSHHISIRAQCIFNCPGQRPDNLAAVISWDSVFERGRGVSLHTNDGRTKY